MEDKVFYFIFKYMEFILLNRMRDAFDLLR